MVIDQNDAECLVFTFKEGLLSAVAHDLKLRVSRFTVTVEEPQAGPPPGSPSGGLRVEAVFYADSLRVVCAMRDGAERPELLGAGDIRKIERTIAEEVLHAARFPEIRLGSQRVTKLGQAGSARYDIAADLTLHGVTRPLRIQAREEAGRRVGEVLLHQPDFGIRPYSAMLGTLKIRSDVRVHLSLPAI